MSFQDVVKILRGLNSFAARKSTAQLKAELMNAIMYGRTNIVAELVLYERAPVNFATSSSLTPLGLAAQRGYFHIMKFLIERNADVNVTVSSGEHILHIIVQEDYAGLDPYRRPMTELQRYELIKMLVDKGADINAVDNKGYTPLHSAACYGNIKTVEWLLELGAAINAQTADNNSTALHIAAMCGRMELVKLLVGYGADISVMDLDGKTPRLLIAECTDNAHKDISAYLLDLYIAAQPIEELLIPIDNEVMPLFDVIAEAPYDSYFEEESLLPDISIQVIE